MEGILHDISEHHENEARQRKDYAQAQALLNATPDAGMLFNTDGTLLACNQVFAQRVGMPVDQVIGRNLFELFPQPLADQRRAACAEVVRSGHSAIVRDERAGRKLQNTITPMANPAGGSMVAVFSRDITEELADKDRIETYVSAIRRSNEELEQFAYVASHDLREPLRQISSFIGLLERRHGDALTGEAREFMDFIRDGAQRMDTLILDLLAFSRVTRSAADMQPVALLQPIEESLKLLPALPEDSITCHVPRDLVVQGDLSQLTRLFQNLIGNALKYRHPERAARIQIRASREDGKIRVEVEDNGIGIDNQYFDRIFRIFQRLHGHDRYDGTGIGLAVVKRVADNHHGTVSVTSTPGQGSIFTVTLPAME